MATDLFEKGLEVRRAVLGKDFVDKSSSDAVITMLPNGHEVSRVVLGVEGDDRDCLLGSMQKGSILVDMSSSSPTGTQALGKTLADHGKSLAVRTECIGTCGKTFQAVGVAIPATIRELCNMSKSSVICSAK